MGLLYLPTWLVGFYVKCRCTYSSPILDRLQLNFCQEFLVEFIDSHYEAYEGPALRDGMDQRVFNKFVMSNLVLEMWQTSLQGMFNLGSRFGTNSQSP